MTLTPEQKQTVSSWVAAGDSLSIVQKKLADQFKISMTYMDVRFLVDDLGLELKNATPRVDPSDVSKAGAPRESAQPARPAAREAGGEKKGLIDKLKEKVGIGGSGDAVPAEEAIDEGDLPEEFADDDLAEQASPGGGAVKIEIDRLVRPGAMVSGSVTFSDGVSGKWALDQYGRLMLDTGKAGYQPSAPDVQAFQRELSAQLQRHGY
jgi:hypothetical protein